MNSSQLTYNAAVGGFVFTFAPYIDKHQLVQTIILASVGAVVSLVVTLLFRALMQVLKRKNK